MQFDLPKAFLRNDTLMSLLLIVDDDEISRWNLTRYFADTDIDVIEARTGTEGLEMVRQHNPDAVILDVMLPDFSGLEVFRQIQELDSRLPVVMITATRSSETVIEAMKLGAMDFLVKPLRKDSVCELIAQAVRNRRLMRVPVDLGGESTDTSGPVDSIIGCGPAMQEVYKGIGRVAKQNLTVLIRGESGTGKELVARAIYQHSERSKRPFLAVNCAAIPESILESELFGHEQGAYTGADCQRIGKFEQCHGGTLFLDEVGDTTPITQTKLLRVLQDQTFQRVGGNRDICTDVRIITATNRDLESMVTQGTFRADLYYRLSVVEISLPPLRDRIEDIPILVNHFLKRYSRELRRDCQAVSEKAMQILQEYRWSGNIRELQSIVRQTLLRSNGLVIFPELLPIAVRGPLSLYAAKSPEGCIDSELDDFVTSSLAAGTHSLYADAIQLLERHLLQRVLNQTGGNQSQAAETLGITRVTLRNKMRSLGISVASHLVQDSVLS